MKKYKLLKDLPFYNKGEILYVEGDKVFNDEDLTRCSLLKDIIININFRFLIGEWFEEIKEELEPKFKVGDYVVLCHLGTEYLKINEIHKTKYVYLYNGYKEEDLRKPTEEELKIYFR